MKKYILLIMLCLPVLTWSQNASWELVKETDNNKVYTRNSGNDNLKELKITGTMNCSLNSFMTAICDATFYTQWVYKCIEAKIFKEVSRDSLYYYTVTDFPYPLSNRDIVVLSTQGVNAVTGEAFSHSIAQPNKLPYKSDLVRIELFESKWTAKEIEPGKVSYQYVAMADPNGNIPVWMTNMTLSIGPLNTIEKLEEIVRLPHFKNAPPLSFLAK